MSLDTKKFERELPKFFPDLFKEIYKAGFVPVLVGGVVRDFFLTGKLGKDWDVELYHETLAFSLEQWKDFGRALTRYGRVTFLPYEVIRLDLNQHQLEFSPPRREEFQTDNLTHKNFSVVFDYKMDFSEAVKRRDFTINAMGIKIKNLKEFLFLDPLEGLRHLREHTLHPAGENFMKDPVRFLRAQRFSRKFQLQGSQKLQEELKQMNLSGVTPAYVWSEMQKSGDPLNYYLDLLKAQDAHPELLLPAKGPVGEIRNVLHDPKKHECWMIALEWVGISCESWQKYFSLSAESVKRVSRWATESRAFQKIKPEFFHGEFDEVRILPEFETLFDWYFTTKQLLQKSPELALLKMIEEYLPDWIHLYRFEMLKDVKHIDPPLRAKYQVWNLCQRL